MNKITVIKTPEDARAAHNNRQISRDECVAWINGYYIGLTAGLESSVGRRPSNILVCSLLTLGLALGLLAQWIRVLLP